MFGSSDARPVQREIGRCIVYLLDLGFALDLVLYPPVVVVDEQDVDGDRGVDEEGHGEEEGEGVLFYVLRLLKDIRTSAWRRRRLPWLVR